MALLKLKHILTPAVYFAFTTMPLNHTQDTIETITSFTM